MEKHKCVLCEKPNADMMIDGCGIKPNIYYHWCCGNNKELIEKYNKKTRE